MIFFFATYSFEEIGFLGIPEVGEKQEKEKRKKREIREKWPVMLVNATVGLKNNPAYFIMVEKYSKDNKE